MVGVCFEKQEDYEYENLLAKNMEGYRCAALLHRIFFVWPTEKAKKSIEYCPGVVDATHKQFASNSDDPNNPNV